MANRVVISICGEEYTLVADETPSYMQKVGSYVSDKMTDVMNAAKVGRTDAAVLTAVNLTDELFKSQTAAEQLRGQIKGYLDEASKAQSGGQRAQAGGLPPPAASGRPQVMASGASFPRRFAGGSPCRRAERLRRGVSGLGRVQRPPGRQKFHGRGICRRHPVLSCPGRPGLSDPEYPGDGPGAARRAGRRPHRPAVWGWTPFLVQDWGLFDLLRQTLPDLPLHASTQMSVFTGGGVQGAVSGRL